MIKLLYWAFVTFDVIGLLFLFVLGLAAAGSSHTSPLMVALVMLLLPAIPLTASVWIFLRASSVLWRVVAFTLAAAPLVLAVSTKALSDARVRANSNAQGELTFFKAGPQRELVEAIARNDAAAVTALLPRVNVNASGMADMTPLVAALRQLRTTPTQHEVVKALLSAGADPNVGTAYELPLEMALQIVNKTGLAPLAMLLDAGADVNRKNAMGMPIFFSGAGLGSNVDALSLLLKHGADLRATGPKGETILIYAADARSWRAAGVLLAQGADPALGRSFKGLTFSEMVDEAARERKARDDYDGKPREDDGFQTVVDFLRRR